VADASRPKTATWEGSSIAVGKRKSDERSPGLSPAFHRSSADVSRDDCWIVAKRQYDTERRRLLSTVPSESLDRAD
jgi:hypothetical protein